MKRIETQGLEHSHLENEVDPRKSDEHGEEEDNDACVESQDVAKRHQRPTLLSELLTNGIIHRKLLYQRTKQLKFRRLTFLSSHISYIKEEVELLEPLLFVPRKTLESPLLLDACIKLATLLSKRHPEVDVAIIIGNSALTRVAIEACPKNDEENPNAPCGIETNGDSDVDADEPQLATKAIEHSAHKCRLSSHASKLSVGTIVPIRPNEKQHADEVVTEVVESKEIGRSTTNNDTQQSDDNRMNMQPTEEERPQIAWGASDIEFEVALYISRLHCGKHTFP